MPGISILIVGLCLIAFGCIDWLHINTILTGARIITRRNYENNRLTASYAICRERRRGGCLLVAFGGGLRADAFPVDISDPVIVESVDILYQTVLDLEYVRDIPGR